LQVSVIVLATDRRISTDLDFSMSELNKQMMSEAQIKHHFPSGISVSLICHWQKE